MGAWGVRAAGPGDPSPDGCRVWFPAGYNGPAFEPSQRVVAGHDQSVGASAERDAIGLKCAGLIVAPSLLGQPSDLCGRQELIHLELAWLRHAGGTWGRLGRRAHLPLPRHALAWHEDVAPAFIHVAGHPEAIAWRRLGACALFLRREQMLLLHHFPGAVRWYSLLPQRL